MAFRSRKEARHFAYRIALWHWDWEHFDEAEKSFEDPSASRADRDYLFGRMTGLATLGTDLTPRLGEIGARIAETGRWDGIESQSDFLAACRKVEAERIEHVKQLRKLYGFDPPHADAAPGWYPDPEKPPRPRRWDGTKWTDPVP